MSIKRILILVVCAVLIGLCAWQIGQIPPLLQYVLPAPEAAQQQDPGEGESRKSAQSPLQQTLRRLEHTAEGWNGILSAWAVTADAETVQMTGVGSKTAAAHLTGEYGSSAALPQRFLSAGRNFYEEELARGTAVMILDEQLAIALFRVSDPVGRTVEIDGQSFTVVGIARHTRAAGDMEAYAAYTPLLALQEQELTTLTVWGAPVAGAGALSKFKADMQAFAQNGNLYSLTQERFRALLPAWLLAAVICLLLLLTAYRALARIALNFVADLRDRLQHCFAVQMIPRMIGYAVLCLLMLAAVLAASYGWAQLLLMPITAFPEWVPAVPVEISEIMKTYWQNVGTLGRAVEYRSAQVQTLRMWRMLLRLPCLLAGAVGLYSYGRIRRQYGKRETAG